MPTDVSVISLRLEGTSSTRFSVPAFESQLPSAEVRSKESRDPPHLQTLWRPGARPHLALRSRRLLAVLTAVLGGNDTCLPAGMRMPSQGLAGSPSRAQPATMPEVLPSAPAFHSPGTRARGAWSPRPHTRARTRATGHVHLAGSRARRAMARPLMQAAVRCRHLFVPLPHASSKKETQAEGLRSTYCRDCCVPAAVLSTRSLRPHAAPPGRCHSVPIGQAKTPGTARLSPSLKVTQQTEGPSNPGDLSRSPHTEALGMQGTRKPSWSSPP